MGVNKMRGRAATPWLFQRRTMRILQSNASQDATAQQVATPKDAAPPVAKSAAP
ncbi:hypothetical protein [Streptomyces sp. NPDC001604]|uniref:hypothetical protein n=1 Tax=Streptomyces sp. NPDC001604 TaxID=3364593 RepID=UPI00369F3641